MTKTSRTFRPKSLSEALEIRADARVIPFAGGTDLMVHNRRNSGVNPRFDAPVLFLDAIDEIREITRLENEVSIGAATPLAQLLEADVPELLKQSIRDIGGPALRNRATIGGNICNASPAGDTLPALYVHEATVVLESVTGTRIIGIDAFQTGPGRTDLGSDEILTRILIPILAEGSLYYRKVGTRRANAISKLSAAGYAASAHGRITDFRFAYGAVAPTVVRIPDAERLVINGEKAVDVLDAAGRYISPIDDQRSSAGYRRQVTLNALEEFLHRLEEDV
jgi:xanthine dehydrogenase FAD-binding subunit